MKTKHILFASMTLLFAASCNSYLDTAPQSSVTESVYFESDTQLDSYVMDLYPNLYTHSSTSYKDLLTSDEKTDDKTQYRETVANYIVGAGGTTVPASDGEWDFEIIRQCNYFFDRVLPKNEAGSITGSQSNIDQYIGEMYFFRAYEYFDKYVELGDMPIATTVPELDFESLTISSIREPRNEVARFILEDLDRAIELLADVSPDGKKNRLTKNAAYLFKSRVALFEGSWLKNFAGTAFVPGGSGWPGASIHPDFSYSTGSVTAEADWFFQQAMDAAKVVAESTTLTQQNSTCTLQQDPNGEPNPFFDMFCDDDMSGYDEILIWRDYDKGLGVAHNASVAAAVGNDFSGTSKGLIESFLMANGLPIYAEGSGYYGDDTNNDLVIDRDGRLQLFLKVPGQTNKLYNADQNTQNPTYEDVPNLFHASFAYVTGYALRKFGCFDGAQMLTNNTDNGCPIFRAAEAYLNYIEASYEKNGSIDATAEKYWKALRQRANVDTDFNKTIAATNMSIEADGDWGAYTAGQLVDATRYNIRRERRNELMSEGFRMRDVRRWRSMDQMITTPFIIKGFKLWNSTMTSWYDGLLIPRGESGANVSPAEDGDYLCPLRIVANHQNFDGYRWTMAHYLTPIAANHFNLTGGTSSPIHQNPGWSITSGDIAESI
ncbi:MAG: RagB/SusD family nutrient uptake outer membrane protein [Rikenellaceae bacterium]